MYKYRAPYIDVKLIQSTQLIYQVLLIVEDQPYQ
jgi:hypothetical protein